MMLWKHTYLVSPSRQTGLLDLVAVGRATGGFYGSSWGLVPNQYINPLGFYMTISGESSQAPGSSDHFPVSVCG
jgi:hypothetical protein